MRAALLPAGGDPFLNAYWLRHAAQWADEVDELRMIVCGPQLPEVRDYIAERVARLPNAVVEFFPSRTDHGHVMRSLLDRTSADLVVFLEDDAFVRHPGVIDERFRLIESGEFDAVGCARGNATDRLIAAAETRFGKPEPLATGETGLSLYPCFFFGRKADLLDRTDGNFSARNYGTGTVIPELGVVSDGDDACDTFTATSWQLRDAGLRIRSEAAYRSAVRGLDAPWFHVGSLSSGYGGSFMNDWTPEQKEQHYASIRPAHEIIDWTKRMSWWTRVWDRWDGGIPDHHRAYGEALEDFIEQTGMDRWYINHWRQGFDELVTWPEV